MSKRKPKRKGIKIDPSLLQDKFKLYRGTWRIVELGLQITLKPTKGYSVWKIPESLLKQLR